MQAIDHIHKEIKDIFAELKSGASFEYFEDTGAEILAEQLARLAGLVDILADTLDSVTTGVAQLTQLTAQGFDKVGEELDKVR